MNKVADPPRTKRGREAWTYILVFVLGGVTVAGFLSVHISSMRQDQLSEWQARQSAIVNGQLRMIADWLSEREGDVQLLADRESVRAALRARSQAAGQGEPAAAFPELTESLDKMARLYVYAGIYLLDRDGHVVVQSHQSPPLNPLLLPACRTAVKTGALQIQLAGDRPDQTMIAFSAPVPPEPAIGGRQSIGPSLGVALVVASARQTVFPHLTRETVPTRTGETVMVRREGDDVVFISPSRFLPASSPYVRIPYSQAPVAARQALEGSNDFLYSVDYRHVPVLAATRHIRFPDWGLVRKVDRAEALQDFRRQAVWEIFAGILLLSLLAGLLLLYRRHVVHSERRKVEQQLRRLNRALRTLSACNQVLVQARTEQELFDSICRKLVELGGYRMAWVGCAEQDEAKTVRPVAYAGFEDGYLKGAQFTWADEPHGRGPSGTAIRSGQSVINRDSASNPTLAPWREEVLKRGYVSTMALPIRASARIWGALTLAAEEADAFDGEEVELLSELAGDLGFGVETIRTRAERDQAEDMLRASEVRFRTLVENAPVGIYRTSADGHILMANPALLKMLECGSLEELEMRGHQAHLSELDYLLHCVADRIEQEGEIQGLEISWAKPDGSVSCMRASATVVRTVNGDPAYYDIIIEDVTRHKRAEEQLRLTQFSLEHASDAVFWMDPGGRIVYVNDAACRSLGRPREEVLSLSIPDIDPKFSPEAWRASWERLKKLNSNTVETLHRTKDGTTFPVEVTSNYVEFDGKEYAFAFARDITERQRAAEALEREKAFTEAIIDSFPDVFFVIKSTGRFLHWGRNPERILGYTQEETLAMNSALEIVAEVDRSLAAGKIQEAFERGRTTAEIHLLKRDGTKVPYLVTATRAVIAGEVYMVGLGMNITDRKRAEEALKESEARFRTLIEEASVAIGMGRDDVNIYGNRKFVEMYGYEHAEEIMGRPIGEFWAEESRGALEERRRRRTAGVPGANIWEGTGQRRDGSHFLVQAEITTVNLPDGPANLVFLTDITERKQAEEKLKASEEKFRQAFMTAADLFYISTVNEGRIIEVNERCQEIFGYTREEMIGKTPSDLGLFEDPADREKIVAAIKSKGFVRSLELRGRKKTGESMTGQVSVNVLQEGGEHVMLGVIRDVTGTRQLEEQLRQSQKMEAIGQLAGGVAHDFNNLLTIISGYSQLLQEQARDSDRAFLQEILKASDRAASLTRQLLAFSRRQILTPQVLDLNSLVTNLEKMLRRLIGEDIQLTTVRQKGLGQVKADPGQIEQVILNLVVNARDAMPRGGKVTVETANVEIDEAYANTHAGATPGRHVMLAVSDTGQGMDAQTRKRIFEPFFTTKEQGKGTGLGLAVVDGVVKQSSGSIWVYSEPERGTTFKIYLPRIDEPDAEIKPAATGEGAERGTETILVVEDEAGVRSLVCATLRAKGYTVLEASGPLEAVSLVERHADPIHLLLTDVVMPQMGGKELADRVSPLRPEMKALFMSGYTDDAVVRHGILEANTFFLQKPFTSAALGQKVREVLDLRP